MSRLPRVPALALLLAIPFGGCEKSSGPRGGGADAPAGGIRVPWRDGPSPDVAEALARVPALAGGTALIVDFPALRAQTARDRSMSRQHGAVELRRFLVADLGLPDGAFRVGVHVEREDERTSWPYLKSAKVPLDAVREAARATLVEVVEASGGRTVWKSRDGEETVAIWEGGWVSSPPRARSPDAPGAPDPAAPLLVARPEVAAALGGLPADALARGSVEVVWGEAISPSRYGPEVRPLATAEWHEADPLGAGIVFAFASEEERTAARGYFEERFEEAKTRGMGVGTLAVDGRGKLLRMMAGAGVAERDPSSVVRSELRTLLGGLRRYRDETGSFPSTAEGLAALRARPRLLDDFLGAIPVDAWGQPYHYRAPKPGADDPDLRSRGPDREIDTEDDLFPDD